MLTLFVVSICLFFISLTGWTVTTYFVKKDSQQFIREELKNLFNICNKFILSIKNLIGILSSNSVSSESSDANPVEKNILNEDEQTLSVVQPVQEIEAPSLEVKNDKDDDTALSSFSPEVVEVINEEEEKVA
tara:strand:- start:255 stop:650 length:396 start_codon:yes stop_codon:yes gene_type:complete